MPNYRRIFIPNSMVFITSMTFNKKPYLENKGAEKFLEVVKHVGMLYTFSIIAYVIMPNHFHWIIKTEDQSTNFSKITQSVKWNFIREYKKEHGITTPLKIWQDRFWDHVIRDENDLNNHIEYIHWNPVKHGFTDIQTRWKYSSIHQFINDGYYEDGIAQKEIPEYIVKINWE